MLQTTPARAIRRLARDIDGFEAHGVAPDGTQLRRAPSHTYGELTPTGVSQLIATTHLSAGDRFVDLGSGTGKVVVQVAMQVPGVRCTGIELDSERHKGARKLLRAALAEGLVARRQVTLRHDSILTAELTGATVLFANSTCFPAPLLAKLAERVAALGGPLIFVSLQALGRKQARLFDTAKTRRCATSWDPANEMHIYRLTDVAI